MNPARNAEEILNLPNTATDREMAMVYAMLAIADGLQSVAHSIEEASRNIATELGGIALVIERKE